MWDLGRPFLQYTRPSGPILILVCLATEFQKIGGSANFKKKGTIADDIAKSYSVHLNVTTPYNSKY
jgi:hypothetical protein